jgi:hypothetical protein
LLAAAESQAIGRGGIVLGLAGDGNLAAGHPARNCGTKDPTLLVTGRVRRQGGRRKKAVEKDAAIRSGTELRRKGDPERLQVHDLVDPDPGRATPYGSMMWVEITVG